MTSSDAGGWADWAGRWERFQNAYVPDRGQQISTVIDYLDAAIEARRPGAADRPPRLLDLCCGAGSIAARFRVRRPTARIVGIDADPWLLAMAEATVPGPDVTWLEADLRRPGWPALAGGPFDAAVLFTAVHWFEADELRALYADVFGLLMDGGVLAIGDVVPDEQPVGSGSAPPRLNLPRLGLERVFRAQQAALRIDPAAAWPAFWRAAEAEPAFQPLLAARAARLGQRRPRRFLPTGWHRAALTDAGFTQVCQVWRRDALAVLVTTVATGA